MVRTGTMKVLKEATRADHERVEAYAVTRALADGALTMAQYRTLLDAYRALHEALLARVVEIPTLEWAAPRILARIAWLESDLRHLAGAKVKGMDSVALAFTARLTRVPPAAIVGACYVFEGASLGNAFLLPRLCVALALSPVQSRYFLGLGPRTMAHFAEFGAWVNGVVNAESASDAVLGARIAFDAVGTALEAIEASTQAEAPRAMGRATSERPRAALP
jgi:heme oxygenase (biliverdin-IX-beta and delta-forming)